VTDGKTLTAALWLQNMLSGAGFRACVFGVRVGV